MTQTVPYSDSFPVSSRNATVQTFPHPFRGRNFWNDDSDREDPKSGTTALRAAVAQPW